MQLCTDHLTHESMFPTDHAKIRNRYHETYSFKRTYSSYITYDSYLSQCSSLFFKFLGLIII